MGRRACKGIGSAGIVRTVSFIIPCREINSMVVGLVHNLSILLPENHDVIVSLDRDHLRSEEESIIGGFPPTTRLLFGNSARAQGPAGARNRGAQHSRGDVLVFIDNDISVHFSFAPEFVSRLQKSTVPDIVTTRVDGKGVNPYSRFFTDHVLRVRKIHGRLLFPSAVMALERSLFEELEGFDEGFPDAGGEDWDFMIRLNDLKPFLQVFYHYDLTAFHANPETLRELLARAWRYGFHANRYLEKNSVRKHTLSHLARKVIIRIVAPANRMAVRFENTLREIIHKPNFRPLTSIKFAVFQLIRRFQATSQPINRRPQEFLLADRMLFRLPTPTGRPSRGGQVWRITETGAKIDSDFLDNGAGVSHFSTGGLQRILLETLWRQTHRAGVIIGYCHRILL